jgi:4-aminobutyrate aminotransferase-like enzyme/Ser/Thr protein kinase RdoA (MazF antagonist)
LATGRSLEELLALRGRPPAVDVATAERVARELYGLSARATPLDGERDRNYRLDTGDGRRLVLKFIDHEADDVVVDGQSAALAHLAEQNSLLPVPRVVPTRAGGLVGVAVIAGGDTTHGRDTVAHRDAIPGRDTIAGGESNAGAGAEATAVSCRVRLVTYLPGRLMQDVRASDADSGVVRSVGYHIAQLDRALAGFFHPALAQPIVWDVRRAAALMPMLAEIQPPELRSALSSALESLEQLLPRLRGLRSQAIHGDCHGRNLLVNDAGDACVGIIDLGDMIHAPLALEIAVTMAELLIDGVATLDELPELLAGYTSLQPLERADVEVLYDLITARIAIGVLIQAWRDRNGGRADVAKPVPGASANAGARAVTSQRGPLASASGGAQAAQSKHDVLAPASGGGATNTDLATASAAALEALAARGREQLTQQWLEAAGVESVKLSRGRVVPADLVRRRHKALGANAELSYDQPLHLVRGEGVWVYTSDAERFLDVYNNVPHVGHAHPAVVAAIASQAKRIASNTRYLDTRIIEYVERLTETLPPDLDACLFVNSGSEANDIAWRMAKSHTGHEGALVMNFAYHGITDAVTALSPAICPKVPAHVEQLAAPLANDIASAAEADVAAAIARLGGRGYKPAALLIDSALTSTGIYDPPPTWITAIAAAVRKAGGLIIGDEVQFGLGRSGSHFWGFTRRGYHPDIVTLGKPVGNGYPLGVVITRRALLEKFQRDTGFFSTFGGNPVAAAAGLAVLDVLDKERLVENARVTGDYFIRRLKELAQTHAAIRDVRGAGLMVGAELTDKATTKRVVNGLRERGVLTGSEGPNGNVLKLRPPMPFHMEHVEIVIEALNATLLADRP